MIQMSRLPGRSVKAFGWSFQRHQLWLSPEYLLYREISIFREAVKRYYYGDIQAIVSGPTKRARDCSIVLGFIVAICLGIFVSTQVRGQSNVEGAIALAIGALSAMLLAVNLILGPSCKTVLYTATSEAPLYSLGRKRSAEKAIALMLPFIEAAQRGEAPAVEPVPAPEPVGESPAWTPPTEG